MSDYNDFHERLLSADLGAEEWQLAIALVRCLLGHRKRSESFGRRLLQELSGLHGRSFERARAGLIVKGLLRYEPAPPGRGHRSHYELLVEKAAQERPFTAPEKAAQERPFSETEREGQMAAQMAAQERPRIEKGSTYRLKDLRAADEEKLEKDLGPLRRDEPLARPERTWDEIAAFVRAHGGTGWGPVLKAVSGDAGYLSRRRDWMLEEGVLVDAGADFGATLGRRFQLWHRDDPARP